MSLLEEQESMALALWYVGSPEVLELITHQTVTSQMTFLRIVALRSTSHPIFDYSPEANSGNVKMLQTDQPYVLQIHNECKHLSLRPTHCHIADIS